MEHEGIVERKNLIGVNGEMWVEGRFYDLQMMDEGELAALHQQLSIDADLIRAQLRDSDLEQTTAGWLPYEVQEWRNRARHALALKKKSMAAIHGELARRKTLVPPLTDFAFSAIYQIAGEEMLAQVEAQARKLHDDFVQYHKVRGAPVSGRLENRGMVCGRKIRHADEESALAQIASLEAAGADIRDLQIYPCPWCKALHVGNSPLRRKHRRQREREAMKRKAAADGDAISDGA